jgi:kynurenine formamidase
MYNQDMINQFIELRAEEKSYRHIADILKISTGLASKWAREHETEIAELTFARKEALRERYVKGYGEKLADIAREIDAIDEELKHRDFEDVSTEFLLYRKTCQQARQEKLAALPLPRYAPPVEPPKEMNKNERN